MSGPQSGLQLYSLLLFFVVGREPSNPVAAPRPFWAISRSEWTK